MIKCSNCSRKPQPDDQFLDAAGRVTKSCLKCRTKGAKRTFTAEQRDRRLAQQRENKYYVTYRDKKRAENEQGFLAQNASIMREYRQDHRAELLQWSRTNFKRRLDSIKAGARYRGIVFQLTDDECQTMMVDNGTCFYCNEPDPKRIIGLDRLDSSSGYVTSNVRPCCETCNMMKKNLDAKTFVERCRHIAEGIVSTRWPDTQSCSSYRAYRARATKKHLPFDLNPDQFQSFQARACSYCARTQGHMGVDRVDSTRGYTMDNVVSACSECNYMKAALPCDVFQAQCKRVSARALLLCVLDISSIEKD